MEKLTQILKLITQYPWQAGMIALTLVAIIIVIMEHLVQIIKFLKNKTQ